jgi:enterochelin esterase family protein
VVSPEVAPDRRVTFRLRAPNANEVFLTGLGQRLPMEKNEQGVWTVTTQPLEPEIYTYSFSVDGATFNDPANSGMKTSFRGGGQSQFRVPGETVWSPGDVPRGVVAHHFYKSAVIGDQRDFYVYTPPNYDPARKEPYPVLYLLHGLGDDASAWTSTGAAHVILDNLIAQGKAKPMVMVNTLGYGTADMLVGGRGNLGGDQMMPNFTRALLTEVLPQVEKAYRVSKDRNQRAIAGLSMGGAEALYAALNHPDQFAWVSSFSGAFVMWPGVMGAGRGAAAAPAPVPAPPAPAAAAPTPGTAAPGAAPAGGRGGMPPVDPAVFAKTFPALTSKVNSQFKLLEITCGTEDGLNGINRQFKNWLKSKDVAFVDGEKPGFAHVWPLWRRNLAELAPRLFQ